MSVLDARLAERLASLALDCVHREYPNKIGHVLHSADDAGTPRQLTPAFYGCFDWHSAVHGHWTLARLAHVGPPGPHVPRIRAALDRSLTADNIAGEVAYLSTRRGFERPYGLAWLLCLAAELREWADADAERWSGVLAPLEVLAAAHLADWLPQLTHPIRSGEHSQTAFAMGLIHDWAAPTHHPLGTLVANRARDFHLTDKDGPLAYEPSGHDFLSPCLAEADLLRRILPRAAFDSWLTAFLPDIPAADDIDWLPAATSPDPTDGKLAHLDGLALSRAWMLDGIAAALDSTDPRQAALEGAADRHRDAGLARVTGAHYAGGHWLGTFAVYLLTRRGLRL